MSPCWRTNPQAKKPHSATRIRMAVGRVCSDSMCGKERRYSRTHKYSYSNHNPTHQKILWSRFKNNNPPQLLHLHPFAAFSFHIQLSCQSLPATSKWTSSSPLL